MSSETAGMKDLADRYAVALYDLASETRQLDSVAADLRSLSAVLDESADARRFVASPVLSRADQKQGILAIADRLGVSPLTRKFLGILAVNRRLFGLSSIIAAFFDKLAQARGEVTAEVISARELSEDQARTLAHVLKKEVGRDVAVRARVDSSLLGGLVIQIGSRMIDGSLRAKLQKLQLAMKGIG